MEEDELRTLTLTEKKGFKVIRFTNQEVIESIDVVLNKIEEILKVHRRDIE